MAENKLYDKGIKVAGSFSAPGAFPLDSKLVVDTIAQRDDHVTQNRSYEGMIVYVKANQTTYQLRKDGWKELLGPNITYEPVEPGTYINAENVVQNESYRFVTDEQIASWNNGTGGNANIEVVTSQKDGLMSKTDKAKLDGIANNANRYIHPDEHPATMIIEDEEHRFVTDNQIMTWDSGSNIEVATQLIDGLMSKTDKAKLDDIEANANNYEHPTSHPATMIIQDSTHKFVTDTEKEYWNSKSSIEISDTEPEDDDVKIWVDDSNNSITEEFAVPEIKDTETSKTDTWSSYKISQELAKIPTFVTISQEAYDNLATKSATTIYIII